MRRRSPFGVLDDPLPERWPETVDSSYATGKRPSSANAAIRKPLFGPSVVQRAMYDRFEEAMQDLSMRRDGPAQRARPLTAGAVRPRAASQQRRAEEQGGEKFFERDSLAMLEREDDERMQLKDIHPSSSQRATNNEQNQPVPLKKKKKKQAKKDKDQDRDRDTAGLKTINKVQLSDADWEKIFHKYRIAGVEELKFNFLKKGKGFTTKLDHIGKQQLERKPRPQSPLPRMNESLLNGQGTESEKLNLSLQESMSPIKATIAPSAPSPGGSLLRLSTGASTEEGKYLREYRKKKESEEQGFAALLEKELKAEAQHLQSCIDECNQLCEFLNKNQRFVFRDLRTVRKLLDISPDSDWQSFAVSLSKRAAQSGECEQSTQSVRLIPVDKFHDDHAALLREFKVFSKYHPSQSLDKQVTPPGSAHFIGVNELMQSAKRLERSSSSDTKPLNNSRSLSTKDNTTKASKTAQPEPIPSPYTSTKADFNEMRIRNDMITAQQKILQECDDLEALLNEQFQEIQLKGWNRHYEMFFR